MSSSMAYFQLSVPDVEHTASSIRRGSIAIIESIDGQFRKSLRRVLKAKEASNSVEQIKVR